MYKADSGVIFHISNIKLCVKVILQCKQTTSCDYYKKDLTLYSNSI